MALQLASPPPSAYDLVAEGLSRVSTAGGAAQTLAAVTDASRLNAALPHELYSLAASDIAKGSHLERAQPIGWRFLVQNGGRTIGAVELASDPGGRNLRFASLDTGPFAQATRDAVARAEGLDKVRSGHYELRVLRASSIYVMALWLKDLDGSDDIVIPIQVQTPLGPASEGGAALPQSAGEFMEGLRSVAADEVAFDSSPPSPPGR